MGKHTQHWNKLRADGRTNSTGIFVSHNLLPHLLTHLTSSSIEQTSSWKRRPETLEGFQRGRCCFALSVTKDNTQIPKEFDFFFFLKTQASFV